MKNKFLLVLFITITTLTACGQHRSAATVNVNMTDFAFTPNIVTVPSSSQVTLEISDSGLVEHGFIIMKLGADIGKHFDEEDSPNIYWQVKLQPDTTQTVQFTAPSEPGVYQIVCSMAGHVEAGMIGTLEVVAP